MSKIEILLASYNGEKYLESQLYSIIAQSYKNWELVIHDDGSTDSTISIIKDFQKKDSRIRLLDDGIKCGGPGSNFMHLLQSATADYIMFCDQDDVWFESKIEVHLKCIENLKGARAVYSNGYTYDGETIKSKNFIEFHRNTIEDSIFLNGGIHGCCIMFNKELLDIAKNKMPSYIYMHDHFITILAVAFGSMTYIDKAMMLYRQHDENVTGNVNLSFFSRLKIFFDTDNPVIESRHYRANESFYSCYKEQLSDEQNHLFIAYLSYPKVSRLNRLMIIFKNDFKSKGMFPLLMKTVLRKAI